MVLRDLERAGLVGGRLARRLIIHRGRSFRQAIFFVFSEGIRFDILGTIGSQPGQGGGSGLAGLVLVFLILRW